MLTKNTLALAVTLLLAGTVNAQQDPNQPTDKGFVMPGAAPGLGQPAVVAAPTGAFKTTVKPGKAKFTVGESVQFLAKGNRDFYLYIISITPEGDTMFLYPKEGESPSRLKADREHKVPENYSIVVDAPGTERVMVVSSLTPLEMASARGIVTPGGATGGGDRQISELDLEIVAVPSYPFTVKTTPDGASVRVMNIGPNYQPGMKLPAGEYKLEVAADGYKMAELTIKHGKAAQEHEVVLESLAGTGTSSPPELILSAEQQVYKDGEQVSVQYGASQAGWVHLYTFIGGELANVASKQVESGKFYPLKATATEPHGEQALVALWQKEEAVSDVTLSNLKQSLGNDAAAEGKPAADDLGQRALVISVETPLNYKAIPLVINP